MSDRGSTHHVKQCQSRPCIDGEPQHDMVEGAVHKAVHASKDGKDPGRPDISRIDVACAVQVKDHAIKQHGNFKQVLQVIRRIANMRRRSVDKVVAATGIGQIFRLVPLVLFLVRCEEGDASGEHA